MLGEMEGTNGRGRPCGEWLDDIKEWCEKDIGYLRRVAQDKNMWKEMVKCSLDTYGLPWKIMMMMMMIVQGIKGVNPW